MKVKDTNLMGIQQGDILLYKARGVLPQLDVLGELIADLEGGKGRYTHAASVRDLPDPEAEVAEVKPGIFKVVDGSTWCVPYSVETPYEGLQEVACRMASKAGIKLEATWPKSREWPVDWENEWMEVWRCRNLSEQNVADVLRCQQDMCGYQDMDKDGTHSDAWGYNIAEFLTFGLLNQSAAKICSQFVCEPIYNSTLLRGCTNGNYAIALTPDLAGIKDSELTPNDLYDSGFLYRVRYQGLLGS